MADEVVSTEAVTTTSHSVSAFDMSNSWPGEQVAPQPTDATQDAEQGAQTDTAQQTAETEPNEQTDQKTTLSSYQRLKQASEAAATESATTIGQLQNELAEIKATPAIRADKPSDEWDAPAALEGFPAAHRDLLVTAVLDSALGPVAQMVAQNPQEYQEDYRNLAVALGPIAEVAYKRPLTEINQIMTLVQGLTPQQIQSALGGENVTINGPYSQGGFQPNAATNSTIYLEAQRAGLDVNDDATARFLGNVHGALSYSQQQMQGLQGQIQNLTKQITQLQNGQVSQSEGAIKATIEQAVSAGRTAAFDLATKDPATGQSRIPAGDTESATTIRARAEFELQSSPLQQHLTAAQKWQKDGNKDAADRALGLAKDVINKAYAKAAAAVLGQKSTVTPPPAPTRLVGGAQAAVVGSAADIIKNAGPIGSDYSKAARIAEELYRLNGGQ